MTRSKAGLAAALVLFTTLGTSLGMSFGASAKDASLPKLDIQKNCRARANSISALGIGLGNPFDQCMKDEQQARAALTAAWKDIPPFYKTTCIHPEVYSPSYFEWIRCLESNIDVKNLRSNYDDGASIKMKR